MGDSFSIPHAASLCIELPRESRTLKALGVSKGLSEESEILSLIEYWCHVAVWQKTKDGEKGRNKPKPILKETNNSNKKENKIDFIPRACEELDILFGRR